MRKARPPPPWRDDWALFLDVDGTLVEIAATPGAVRIPAGLIPALTTARDRLGGAIALVSGRDLASLDRLFAPLHLPGAGAHGAERRSADGAAHVKPVADSLAPAEAFLVRFVAAHKGALLERKQGSLALHYRNVPWLEPAAQGVAAAAAAAVGPAFHVQRGKKVFEIKAASVGKGCAIAEFMSEPPFVDRVPVFIGDDVTDEDGFEVVNALGGHSIAVRPARNTCARWRLADEAEVLRWLETPAIPTGAQP